MSRLNVITRITICLSFLAVGVILLADAAGIIPDAALIVRRERKAFCESVAVHCSLLAGRGDITAIEAALQAIAQRNQDIVSIGVRREDQQLLVDVNSHASHNAAEGRGEPSETLVAVPIFAGKSLWGTIEINFADAGASSFSGSYDTVLLEVLLFTGVFSYCLYYLFLKRVLQDLDPTKVVPDRVRTALDSLTGGLLLIDGRERIVLANKAFAAAAATSPEALQGRSANELPWAGINEDETPGDYPWVRTLRGEGAMQSETIGLRTGEDQSRTFVVNSSPITDDRGEQHGVLASFEDITPLQDKKAELVQMVSVLKESQTAVHRQNEELRRLATRDALTNCLNRRAFFEYFEIQWAAAERYDQPLSCLMVDIDHFKSINDGHGHARGDAVLVQVGQALQRATGDSNAVGRYGGEEFCIVLANTDVAGAERCAERCRRMIVSLDVEGLSVTVSIGVAARRYGATSAQDMLEQADQCLYAAKRIGRNRVVRWDNIPGDLKVTEDANGPALAETVDYQEAFGTIPYNAVSALLSALAYRDAATAAHSTRVADLAAATAQGLMSVSDSYVLEVAALLHDIGKIGVPDAILLKPGQLTEEEWEVMRLHNRIGIEIVASSFANSRLTEIVQEYRTPFGGDESRPGLIGSEIPLGARILRICDAYDAMVNESVYRPARSRDEACQELRECGGTQFDPELVERFVETILVRDPSAAKDVPSVARDVALNIGGQIERIADAVDRLDVDRLHCLTERLGATAAKHRLDELVDLAGNMDRLMRDDPDAAALLRTTHELMELSRSMLQTHVQSSVKLTRSLPAVAQDLTFAR